MEKVWGYKRLVCPHCLEGNKRSKRKGVYKVYETNTHLYLVCIKCMTRLVIPKKESGKQLKVIRK